MHADRLASNLCIRQHFAARRNRSAFSLIEVILATAILMGSVIVLSRLAGMGRTMAQRAAAMSEAQRVCERTLNEIALGERPLQLVDRSPLLPVADFGGTDFGGTDPGAADLQGAGESGIRVQSSQQRWLYSVVVAPH
ncbi:MAG: hypothetical protein KDA96_16610, partial [Planctomycetaceae bacterium]|nr:hypothetical protein [Planctomycetaceae bacterium]